MAAKNTAPHTKLVVTAFQRYKNAFSDEQQLMILYRLYKLFGDTKLCDILAKLAMTVRVQPLEEYITYFEAPYLQYTPSLILYGNKRIQARNDLYAQDPLLYLCDESLKHLFFLQRFDLLETPRLNQLYQRYQKVFSTIDWQSVYCREDVIRIDSSYCFNSVIALRTLNIDTTVTEQAIQQLKELYLSGEVQAQLPDDEYRSFVYSLTHIIIARSFFYERFVIDCEWIIEYFAAHWDQIKQRTTLDIQLEVALCFRLTHSEVYYQDQYHAMKQFLEDAIPWQRLSEKSYVVTYFHSLYIAMFLFAEQLELHPGPTLHNHPLYQKNI